MRLQLLPSVLILLAATIVGASGQAENLPPFSTSAEPDPPQQQIPVADITCMCDPILLGQRGFSCNGMCGDDCANFYKNAMGLAQAPECSWSRCEAQVRIGLRGTYVGKCTCLCSPATTPAGEVGRQG